MSMGATKTFLPTADYAACALFTPGHRTHFTQARLARDADPAKYRHEKAVSVENDGWISVKVTGERLRFWNHNPTWVRRCFEKSGGEVGLPGYGLLHAPYADGSRACICASDGPTPCAPPSTAGSSPAGLFEQVLTHGGFMVSGIQRATRSARQRCQRRPRGVVIPCTGPQPSVRTRPRFREFPPIPREDH